MATTPKSRSIYERLSQNDKVLNGFQNGVERQLVKLGDDVAKRWMKRSETSLRNNLEKIAEKALNQFSRQLQKGSGFSGLNGGDVFGVGAGALLSGILQILGRQKVTTHSTETDRSREATQRFRESRSQEQARMAQQVSRAKRNL